MKVLESTWKYLKKHLKALESTRKYTKVLESTQKFSKVHEVHKNTQINSKLLKGT